MQTFLKEFGKEPEKIFDSFAKKASHGASIGQVHRASIGKRNYAVKVQYPGVAKSLKSDLRLVKPIALTVLGLREDDVDAYFREVETRLSEETDYRHEIGRALELSKASSHLKNLRFPGYYPDLSSRRILTSDWVDGVPLGEFADSDASQEERDRIGQALWDLYDHQVHTLLTFHADPHPGNFVVKDGNVWVLDFGCTKTISRDFHRRQFRFVLPSLVDDRGELEKALRDMEVVLPGDSRKEVNLILDMALTWVELLARPFRHGHFDFSDPAFLKAVYNLGEESKKAKDLRAIRGERGSPDTVYMNRTFFGLYSLLGRIRARVRIRMPELS
jgi:predicted unusual protein kinase regulating ubiquinone biosynthesis (AarF/ABC1/UbiB family)